MEPKNTFENLAKKITGLLPDNVLKIQQDLEANIKTLLQNTLSKMNLVTREEFDVQSALLERTREKLEQLEKQLAKIEKQAEGSRPQAPGKSKKTGKQPTGS